MAMVPHVSPEPNPASISLSPFFSIPLRLTSSRRIATLAADVFPHLSTFIGIFSSGTFRRFAIVAVILAFAEWTAALFLPQT